MTPEQIQQMADGLPPSQIGMDHEEVITHLAEKHIQLQQQVNALAAENSNQRHLLDMIAETGNANFGKTSLPTPATDAAIRELQAQGAISCGIHLREWYDYQVEERAEEFAAQLRNEGGV